MIHIQKLTFNDFQENTYILFDDTQECIIIDPGCNTNTERKELTTFIENHHLRPLHLLNTHCHIDHVLGNRFVAETYGLKLASHKKEAQVLASCPTVSAMYQISYDPSPDIEIFLDEGDTIEFGKSSLKVIFTPGHSPASISFVDVENKICISGDVLFYGSIGRTDLPGGNFETLTRAIKSKIFTLPDDIVVYPGHGPHTTVGHEKRTNPFFN